MTNQSPAGSGYAPVNGLEMYYEVHGTGQPLVLLIIGDSDIVRPEHAEFLDAPEPATG